MTCFSHTFKAAPNTISDEGATVRFEPHATDPALLFMQARAGGERVTLRISEADTITLRDALLGMHPIEPEPTPEHAPAAAPAFAVGDRVKVVAGSREDCSCHGFAHGTIGTVERVGVSGLFSVRGEIDGRSRIQFLAVNEIEPAPLDEPVDPVGSIVYVTGGQGVSVAGCLPSRFENGTAVVVIEDDYDGDGSYRVRPVGASGLGHWISAEHLDVEPPRIPVGAHVRILNDGEEAGCRHWLVSPMGVVEAHDGEHYYEVRGQYSDGRFGRQTLVASSIEQVRL